MADKKPEVTNPANLAPVDPNEPLDERPDIRAARFETKLRRWALFGVVAAIALYFAWQAVTGS
ncbi:hypothetical protein ACN082_10235 [Rothia sp. CCM 9417]|uniref:hypothetical protein n=1 Tax=unclassified Rothia (in: high G+C Gram-positive bacteria) TaxID=2689056 RepID=UPI003AC00403